MPVPAQAGCPARRGGASNRRAGPSAARQIAGLALAGAGLVAAHAVRAEAARALGPAGAGRARPCAGHADASRAILAHDTIRVERAVAQAERGAADVLAAAFDLHWRACSGSLAGGGKDRRAVRARRRAARDGGTRIRAGGAGLAVAGPRAHSAVARAGRARAKRLAHGRGANTERARRVARFALAGASAVAAQAVDAEPALAVACRRAGDACSKPEGRADDVIAVEDRRGVAVVGRIRGALAIDQAEHICGRLAGPRVRQGL